MKVKLILYSKLPKIANNKRVKFRSYLYNKKSLAE